MAKAPTKAEIKRAILDLMSAKKLRANQVTQITPLQIALGQRGIVADEFYAALSSMKDDDGSIEDDRPGFIKLTDKGFAEM
jgi:hypothetical protein